MAATRLNVVTYAGLAMGAGTSYTLTGFRAKSGAYEQLEVEFTVRIANSTPATYRTLWQALETAMRTPNADLSINLGGDTEAWSHSSNTGFLARGDFELLEEGYTKASRRYRCSVTLQLPADESGKGGRQSGSFSVEYSPSNVRTVTIEAVYTALSGNSATEQVDAAAGFAAYVTEVQTLLGGTWDRGRKAVQPDDEDKVASVSAVYTEIIYQQSLAVVLDDPDFVNPQVAVQTTRTSVPQLTGSGARPPVKVDVSFATFVDKDSSTDLPGLIRSKVIPYLRALADAFAIVPGDMTAVASTLAGDPNTNAIQGTVTFVGHASTLVSAELTTVEILHTGTELVPVLDGTKYKRDKYEGPARLYRELTLSVVEFDTGQDVLSGHAIMDRAASAGGKSWHLLQRVQGGKRTEESLPDLPDGTIKLVAIQSTYVLEYGIVRQTSSGGGQTRVRGARAGGGTRVRQSPVPNDPLATGKF